MVNLQLFFVFVLLVLGQPTFAEDPICHYYPNVCQSSRNSSAPAYPSKSSSFNLNPATVPVEDGFGVESIIYKSYWDLAIVKGNGRIGAALSPTNNEETFFGPPGFELNSDYLQRHIDGDKYSSQKIALAAAFTLVKKEGSGPDHFGLNLGLIGKYNKLSKDATPGIGLSGVWGPFTFGYSVSNDEYTQQTTTGFVTTNQTYKYQTNTISGGLFLNSLAIDYSHEHIVTEFNNIVDTDLITGAVLYKKLALTVSRRIEDSPRLAYDPATQSLITKQVKTEWFYGIQYGITRRVLVGGFYNYYLLREYSAGVTWFL